MKVSGLPPPRAKIPDLVKHTQSETELLLWRKLAVRFVQLAVGQ
jgi:hypothetical protein